MQGRLTVVAAERGQTDEGYHRGTFRHDDSYAAVFRLIDTTSSTLDNTYPFWYTSYWRIPQTYNWTTESMLSRRRENVERTLRERREWAYLRLS
jgi:hypothetical protein